MKRRKFIIAGATGAISALVLHKTGIAQSYHNKFVPSLQLYTLRDAIEERGFKAVAEEVYKMGYRNLELTKSKKLGNFYGLTPEEMKATLNNFGLTAKSLHLSYEGNPDIDNLSEYSFTQGFEKACEAVKHINGQYITLPHLPGKITSNPEAIKALVDTMNAKSKIAADYGLTLNYHNHDFEFKTMVNKNQNMYDYMLANLNSDIKFTLDIYWVVKAGKDPADYINAFPGRFPLWHVKDISTEGKTVEVGAGTIEWVKIFKLADKAGLKYPIVEQDNSTNPINSVKESITYLKAKNFFS